MIENDEEVKEALEILQPRASLMVSPYLTALGFHTHCGSNYSSPHKAMLDQAQQLFYGLAAIAGACQQCCNNEEHNSGVLAEVIPAASCHGHIF